MPSKSAKQARLMAACAHGGGYSNCPPANVAVEFNQADKGTELLHKTAQRGHDPDRRTHFAKGHRSTKL